MTERAYPLGGVALSVSLERKIATYNKMNEICKSYGVRFNTCGCKDTALKNLKYALICRNIDFSEKASVA
jgi:hypothetical protein